jgi:hypothetical protein
VKLRSPDRRDRLDPVRRIAPPRPAVLLRAAVVMLLLLLAAGLLYAGPVEAPGQPARWSQPATPGVPAGFVGVPVRLDDPSSIAVLRPGDRVDLLGLPTEAGANPSADRTISTLAREALVLDALAGPDTPVLLLALTDAEAHAVASVADRVRFGVIVRSQSPRNR